MKFTNMYRWRYACVYIVLFIMLASVIARLVDLNILDHKSLNAKSAFLIMRDIPLAANRGIIYDRNAIPLAISAGVRSVWINPQQFRTSNKHIKSLASYLGWDLQALKKKIKAAYKKRFIYLKRRIRPALAKKIDELNIPGLYLEKTYKRFYPAAEVDAHVLGFTNIDDKGQEGIELAYNNWLSGVKGEQRIMRDRLGQVIANEGVMKVPKEGRDITLSIDQRIQFLAYMTLVQTVHHFHAKAGSVVVLDPKTGEILAMVNEPSFNPNAVSKDTNGRFRNRAATDIFEPGSTIKPFTVALALESGKYTPDTKIDTNPGWIRIGGYTVRDDGYYGVVSLTQLLKKSSNIAAAKVMLSLKPQHYWNLLRRVGFGQRTQSGFPGETAGSLVDRFVWHPSVIASMAYGYGVAVSVLQLAAAYSVLANHGKKVPITFLKQTTPPKGVAEIEPKVANSVVQMLKTVLQPGGTGTRGRVKGYQVAGKTGTAYIAGAKGYDKTKFVSSFVGMAPANDPKLVVAVVIFQPKGEHRGAMVAAPAFSKIMGGALRILNISPVADAAAKVKTS